MLFNRCLLPPSTAAGVTPTPQSLIWRRKSTCRCPREMCTSGRRSCRCAGTRASSRSTRQLATGGGGGACCCQQRCAHAHRKGHGLPCVGSVANAAADRMCSRPIGAFRQTCWAGSSHAQVTGLTPCTQPRLPSQPDSRCLLNPTVTAIAFSNSLFNPAQLPLPQLLLPQLRRTSRCTTWTPPTLGRRAGRTFCP